MNRQPTYPYASGNLLEQRNTYFYSTYEGRAFLDAWRQQRDQALRELSDIAPTEAKNSQAPLSAPTDILLESIHGDLSAKRKVVESRALDRLVQRFEVSKRLHGEYDARWRPVDASDYRSLERYIRFAEILAAAYGQTGSLPYLNAMLKVLDTLTSIHAALSGAQRGRLRRVITQERDHIERLSLRLAGNSDAA